MPGGVDVVILYAALPEGRPELLHPHSSAAAKPKLVAWPIHVDIIFTPFKSESLGFPFKAPAAPFGAAGVSSVYGPSLNPQSPF
jgi:hypothetical protein